MHASRALARGHCGPDDIAMTTGPRRCVAGEGSQVLAASPADHRSSGSAIRRCIWAMTVSGISPEKVA